MPITKEWQSPFCFFSKLLNQILSAARFYLRFYEALEFITKSGLDG